MENKTNLNETPAASVSAPAALLVAELLESILLYLPPSKILTVQRTCKFWTNTIEGSRKIQRSLFLMPTKNGVSIQGQEWRGSNGEKMKPILNPLLRSFFYFNLEDFLWFEFTRLGKFKDGSPLGTNINALLRENGSWRQMQAVQPPCKELRYTYECDNHPRCRYHGTSRSQGCSTCCGLLHQPNLGMLKNEQGVNMGQIVDVFVEIYQKKSRHLTPALFPCYEHRLSLDGFTGRELRVLPRTACAAEFLKVFDKLSEVGETSKDVIFTRMSSS